MSVEVKNKKHKSSKKAATSEPLLTALQWVLQAQNNNAGAPSWTRHCRIQDGWVVGFGGAVAAGHRVPVEWFALPYTERLAAALGRVSVGASVVVEDTAITVESGPLRVRVPVLDVLPELPAPQDALSLFGMLQGAPDEIIAAIRRVLPCCRENATTVLESAVELKNGAATATNRVLLLQAWHGMALPRMILPRAAASILVKQTGLTGVGASDNAATFWFGPDKWLRFNLYRQEDYPNVDRIFPEHDHASPLPEGFKEGVEALAPHSGASGTIWFNESGLSNEGGTYKIDGGVPGVSFKTDLLKIVASIATEADFSVQGKMVFYGENLRGALAHSSD